MSRKGKRVADLTAQFHGGKHAPHYAGYFDLFNRQKFFEAHEALEHLWLADRHGANGAFYKGLIQLAGAFVHLQRDHLRPAAALFKLARANLENYPRFHEHLNLDWVRAMIQQWLGELERFDFAVNPLTPANPPKLALTEH